MVVVDFLCRSNCLNYSALPTRGAKIIATVISSFKKSLLSMSTQLTGTNAPNPTQPRTAVLRVNDPLKGWSTRPINDLIMIRGAKGYSWLCWQDGTRQVTAYTLKHYELKLPTDQYIRVHQNCMVNREYVRKIQLTHKGPQINLSTGEKVSISRRRWLSVKRLFKAEPYEA